MLAAASTNEVEKIMASCTVLVIVKVCTGEEKKGSIEGKARDETETESGDDVPPLDVPPLAAALRATVCVLAVSFARIVRALVRGVAPRELAVTETVQFAAGASVLPQVLVCTKVGLPVVML